ncbi:MAG: tandem-95 repeat protein [Chloroflexi bacterium]|nr:tandem-95 repeat protein [Chloroflexota bacterium]
MEDIELLIPFDLFEYNNLEEKYVLVAVDAQQFGEIKELGFKVIVDEEETANFKLLSFSLDTQLETIPSYPCYRTVEETYAAAASLAVNYPNLATWTDVGDTWQKAIGPLDGYDMMVLKLTNNAIVAQKPVLFLTASIHAREYAPAEIATRFAEYLVNNYGIDPDVTWMLDNQEIHIMFHANPDGRKIAEGGVSWRKNRDNDDGCSSTYGVDLNRNFTYQWGTGGSSTNPCDETYRGPSAGSEPETQAIQAYISSVFIDQRGTGAAPADAQGVYIDMHSAGGYVMWPWGYTTTTPPNNTQLQTMGRKLAYFNGYTPGQITKVLYVASGGSVDYAYGEMGVATYAFEVGTNFFEPCTSFTSTVYPANLNALLYAAKVTRTPYMTPLGPDSLSVAVSASTVPAGTSVTLTAQANDTRYRQSNGTEPTQNIAAAEYTIDTPPWESGAAPIAMTAADGSFNASTENITAVVNTSSLTAGRHTIYVRSKDANNNWGAVSAVFLTIEGVANQAPVVSGIPDQTILEGESFASIQLDDFVADPDNTDDQLTWTYSGNSALGVTITNRVAVITVPNSEWGGAETIIFKATDPGGLYSQDAAVFTVTSVNDAPLVSDIPDQTIAEGETFAAINLDNYVSDVDNPDTQITWTSSGSSQLSVSITNRVATISVPNADWNGSETITFRAIDPGGFFAEDSASFTVTSVNDAPVVADIPNQTIAEGGSFATIALDDYVSDVDNADSDLVWTFSGNSSLLVSITDRVATITLPSPDWTGSETITFTAADPLESSDADEAVFAVTVGNKAPVVSGIPDQTIDEGGSFVSINLDNYVTDLDNSPAEMTWSVSGNSALSVVITDRVATIGVPDAEWSGVETLTFRATDPGALYAEDAAVFTVTAVNDAPLVSDIPDQNIAAGGIFTPIALDEYVSDMDNADAELVWSVSGNVELTVTITDRVALISAPAGWAGTETLTFRATDPFGLFAEDAASFTIQVINNAPIATPLTVSTSVDQRVNFTLTGTDPDGDALQFNITSNPTHGTLAGYIPNMIYIPDEGFYGQDSFTFVVFDGIVESEPATVTIEVINQAPVVSDIPDQTIAEGGTFANINLDEFVSDPDNDDAQLTWTYSGNTELVVSITNRIASISAPDSNWNGSETITFRAADPEGLFSQDSAVFTVTAVNYLPVVFAQEVTTQAGIPLPITLTGTDADNDPLSFSITVPPTNGTLSAGATSAEWTYIPADGFTGVDSFAFLANDGFGNSEPAVITITVTPAGPIEVFRDDFETDLGWVRNASGTDTATLGYFERANPETNVYNGDKQLGTTVSGSYDLVTGPLVGSSAGAYDLDGGKTSMRSPAIALPTGRDLSLTFSYYLAHYTNSSSADYLRVYVIGSSSVKVFEELGAANDDDAVWATFEADISSFAGQTVRILIEAADSSTASFVEAAVDDVLVLATNPNNPPTANPQSLTSVEDTALPLMLSGTDPDGSPLSFAVTSNPAHGTLSGTAPSLTYTPTANYAGADSFSFTVNDGKLTSAPAVVEITVTPVNDAPLAAAQSVSTTVDTALAVKLSGTDADGDALTYTVVANPTHGALSGTAPTLTYTPAAGYTGSDSFTFKVNDGIVDSAAATVSITVNPAGPTTVFSDDFESDLGWTFNPNGTDTATLGAFERANPEATTYYGNKQLGTTTSGSYDLVTGPLAGSSAGAYDLDGGTTSVRSPLINLPAGRTITLTLRYYLAHYTNSSSSDYLRVQIIGATTTTIFSEVGANNDDDAVWATLTYNLSSFGGQSVYLLITAADASTASMVEAAIDDVLIIAQ